MKKKNEAPEDEVPNRRRRRVRENSLEKIKAKSFLKRKG